MSKKHFIALADHIINGAFANTINRFTGDPGTQQAATMELVESLADFCASQNPMFKRDRWIAYIKGECGQNGGVVKV